jgi:hypothetical protein
MGVGPVYPAGEEDAMGDVSTKKTADVYRHDAAPIRDWVFDGGELRESHIRLTPAFSGAVDEVEVAMFTKRVRLPGSGAVARLFGRLEAWKAARVEQRAQAAFERGWL